VTDASAKLVRGAWGEHQPGALARTLVWLSRTTLLGRGPARKLLYRLFRTVHSGPVDVEVFGARVRLYPANNVSERKALMRPDRMDAREHAVIRAAMGAPGAVFLDVGANAGLYSLAAALAAGPGARIVAIDPNSELLDRLAFNIAQARRDRRIRDDAMVDRVPVAISAADGTGILAGGADEGSRSLERKGEGREVPLKALAGLVAASRLVRIDAMKIDVEGHEDKVLPPFLATAPQSLWPRLVVIEHLARDRWRPDVISDAEARGYKVLFTTPNNTALGFPV